ncbi:MAG: hypothetical protein ACFFFH_15850 [Candidatus Thorarchaeota archaeon]
MLGQTNRSRHEKTSDGRMRNDTVSNVSMGEPTLSSPVAIFIEVKKSELSASDN